MHDENVMKCVIQARILNTNGKMDNKWEIYFYYQIEFEKINTYLKTDCFKTDKNDKIIKFFSHRLTL